MRATCATATPPPTPLLGTPRCSPRPCPACRVSHVVVRRQRDIDPYVYLSDAGRALPPAERARLTLALTNALLAHPEVDRVFDVRGLPERCPAEDDESIDALVCRAVVPGRAGELYVLPRRGSFFDADVVPGKGTSHGSPYLFDRSVPVVVRAPGRAAAGRVIDQKISFRTYARTLSTLLDVEPPDRDAARATDLARPDHE